MNKTKFKKELKYELFVIPACLSYTVFIFLPLLKSIYYSFTNFDGISKDIKYVGLKNYIQIFSDSAMTSAISYTFFYTFFTVIFITLLAIPLALALDSKMKTKNIQRAVFFFPSVLSALAIGYIWSYIFAPTETGVLNHVLGTLFGIKKVPWLADPILVKISTVIVAVWMQTGWHAVLYVANLQTIPSEYYEAATIDGANKWKKFRYITFPMLAPAMTISIMLLITNGLKVYDMPFALNKGGPGYTTYSICQVIILRGISEMRYGRASAMSVLLFIIIFGITVFQVLFMQRREDKLR